jgi:hypothetical protein
MNAAERSYVEVRKSEYGYFSGICRDYITTFSLHMLLLFFYGSNERNSVPMFRHSNGEI